MSFMLTIEDAELCPGFSHCFLIPCRYIDELIRLKAAAREEGSDYLTWNDIQACVDQVNGTVQEEHESKHGIHPHYERSKFRLFSIMNSVRVLLHFQGLLLLV